MRHSLIRHWLDATRQSGLWIARGLRAWILLALVAVSFPAQAIVDVNKSFSPTTRNVGQTSLLTINFYNSAVVAATSLALTDTMPSGIEVHAILGNTCGGTASFTSTTVALSGGTIPAADVSGNGTCQVTAEVSPTSPGTWVNTILTTELSSSEGNADRDASATLTANNLAAITGSKVFSATHVHGFGTQSFTIRLNNPNAIALTGVSYTDTFPNTLVVASPTAILSNSCGGTVTNNLAASGPIVDGSLGVKLAGGTIPANGSCSLVVTVRPSNNTTFLDANANNTLAAGRVVSTQGVTNTAAISGTIRVQRGAQVGKAFVPAAIASEATTTLVITLRNFNLSTLSGVTFTDSMPANLTVTGTGSNSCGGSLTSSPTAVDLAGATIPAAPSANVSGFGSCSFTAVVTAVAGTSQVTYVNSVPAGTLGGVTHAAASGNLVVNPPSSMVLTKAFAPATVPQSGSTILTITLQNTGTVAASNVALTDSLAPLTSVTIAASPAPVNNCGGTLTATPGSQLITLVGGAVSGPGSCQIQVPLSVAANAAAAGRTNSIPPGNLVTSVGNNVNTTSAVLTVSAGATLAKSFTPATIGPSGISRLTVVITHANGAAAFTGMALTDNIGAMAGHTVASPANETNTCGGTLTANPGSTTVSLSGASLGVGGTSCTFAVDVQAPAGTGAATNTLAAGSLTTDQGVRNATAATATLTRSTSGAPVTLNKSFSPVSVSGGALSQLTISLGNNNAGALALTQAALTDTFPAGMIVADSPAASFTGAGCTLGTVVATPGAPQVLLTGAAIAAGSVCELKVNVTSILDGNLTNDIPVGALQTQQSVTNNNSPAATLTVLRNTNIGKSFLPSTIAAGGTALLKISVYNSNDVVRNGVDPNTFTDNFPPGLTLASATSSNSCGGTVTDATGGALNAADTGIRLNGGVFGINSVCTITVVVTAASTGTYVNTIPAGSMSTAEGSTNVDPAQATLTVVTTPLIAKAFSPASVGVTGTTNLVFTLSNPNTTALLSSGLTGAQFSDTLLGGLAVRASGAAGGTCAGASSNAVSAGQTALALSGLTIPGGAPGTCTVIVTLDTPGTAGSWPNTATGVVSNQTPVAGPGATATLVTLAPPTFAKAFSPASVATGGTGTAVLTLTLINPNAVTVTLANPALIDVFPTSPGQMRVGSPTGVVNTCGGTLTDSGNATLATGDVGIRLNNGSLAPSGSCTISVNVASPNPGSYLNTLPSLTTVNAGSNPSAATAGLTVTWEVNLSITKTNNDGTLTTGNTTAYVITVTNGGPANANGSVLQDPAVAGLACTQVECAAAGGATCPASPDIGTLQGAGLVLPGLPAASSLTFTITCTVTASGS
jgi:uncharacterized repeat protein (TIGR01451 family)